VDNIDLKEFFSFCFCKKKEILELKTVQKIKWMKTFEWNVILRNVVMK